MNRKSIYMLFVLLFTPLLAAAQRTDTGNLGLAKGFTFVVWPSTGSPTVMWSNCFDSQTSSVNKGDQQMIVTYNGNVNRCMVFGGPHPFVAQVYGYSEVTPGKCLSPAPNPDWPTKAVFLEPYGTTLGQGLTTTDFQGKLAADGTLQLKCIFKKGVNP